MAAITPGPSVDGGGGIDLSTAQRVVTYQSPTVPDSTPTPVHIDTSEVTPTFAWAEVNGDGDLLFTQTGLYVVEVYISWGAPAAPGVLTLLLDDGGQFNQPSAVGQSNQYVTSVVRRAASDLAGPFVLRVAQNTGGDVGVGIQMQVTKIA